MKQVVTHKTFQCDRTGLSYSVRAPLRLDSCGGDCSGLWSVVAVALELDDGDDDDDEDDDGDGSGDAQLHLHVLPPKLFAQSVAGSREVDGGRVEVFGAAVQLAQLALSLHHAVNVRPHYSNHLVNLTTATLNPVLWLCLAVCRWWRLLVLILTSASIVLKWIGRCHPPKPGGQSNKNVMWCT